MSEQKLDMILDRVQQIPDLHSEVQFLRAEVRTLDSKIEPLQAEAAVSKEHRNKTCPRRHAGLTSVLVIALVAVLGSAGFALASWLSSEAESKDEIVKALP